MTKFISIDIDGILNNYPICWLNFIEQQTGKVFSTTNEAKLILGDDRYKDIKYKYRTGGCKATLPVYDYAAAATQLILDKGYSIVITTSRPFETYSGLEELTRNWLINNHIKFNYLHKKRADLFNHINNITAHIDDEFEHTILFLERNIPVYLTNDWNAAKQSNFQDSNLLNQTSNLLKFAEALPFA
jgi:hypothetical protein